MPHGTLLGPWAAILSAEDDRDLVLAIDAGSYLTLAFRLDEGSDIRGPFAAALADSLSQLGVSPRHVERECQGVLGLPLEMLRNAPLREALDTVDFVCGIELAYHRDLRIVQRNLSRFPHNLPPHYVPATAAQHLFGVFGSAGTRTDT